MFPLFADAVTETAKVPTFAETYGTVAAWVGAVVAILNFGVMLFILLYTKQQLAHAADRAFLERIKDENFKFPETLPEDEKDLRGRFVRHWVMQHHPKTISLEEFRAFSTGKQTAILQVAMAHDRVVHDFECGLSKKVAMRYQAEEFKKVFEVLKDVIHGLQNGKHGIDTFCASLEGFVTSPEFKKLWERYWKGQRKHPN
jgi:hypothetical protein